MTSTCTGRVKGARCGIGGGYTDIAWNTFFGTNRENFELRAYPCGSVDFHHNVGPTIDGPVLGNNDGGEDRERRHDDRQLDERETGCRRRPRSE